ncbi:MAG: ABC transporter ATP-binding protein [Eubacteriales bacterium]|nr:ABC transporter ATP-binding protein [Eubacteriales bacterium]
MSDRILKGTELCRWYEGDGVTVRALNSVSFEICAGEFVVVLGPSGSGKSTLLNLLGGMDRASAGELLYKGRDLSAMTDAELSDYRRNVVGFVFQFFHLIPTLTAMENVELAASIKAGSRSADEVLDMVGLSDRKRHFPSQMSGGEQQRVSIARAIVKNPDILLCDEPTGALDSSNSVAVVRLLLDVRERIGCPVVTITHNAEMAKVADRVFYMKDGRILRVEENASPLRAEELQW